MNKYYLIRRKGKEFDEEVYKRYYLRLLDPAKLNKHSLGIEIEEVDNQMDATLFRYKETAEEILTKRNYNLEKDCFYTIEEVYVSDEAANPISIYRD